MTSTEKWYKSKTIWASIVVVIATALGFFGIELASADQTALVELIIGAITAVAGFIAIYGRVVATKKIGK